MQPEIQEIKIILENLRLPLKNYLENFLSSEIPPSRLNINRFNQNTQREINQTKRLDSLDLLQLLHFWAENWKYIGSTRGYQDDFIGRFRSPQYQGQNTLKFA